MLALLFDCFFNVSEVTKVVSSPSLRFFAGLLFSSIVISLWAGLGAVLSAMFPGLIDWY